MKAALTGTIAKFTSLADGTVRYMVDVPAERDIAAMHQVGMEVALAALRAEVAYPSIDILPDGGASDDEVVVADRPTRRRFRDLPHTQQMALRCQDTDFQNFLGVKSTEAAADTLRRRFSVESRREITNTQWASFDAKYQGWLDEKRYGAYPIG